MQVTFVVDGQSHVIETKDFKAKGLAKLSDKIELHLAHKLGTKRGEARLKLHMLVYDTLTQAALKKE